MDATEKINHEDVKKKGVQDFSGAEVRYLSSGLHLLPDISGPHPRNA